jgi:vitamin B12 transporter
MYRFAVRTVVIISSILVIAQSPSFAQADSTYSGFVTSTTDVVVGYSLSQTSAVESTFPISAESEIFQPIGADDIPLLGEIRVAAPRCPGAPECEPAFVQLIDLTGSEERMIDTAGEVGAAVGAAVNRYGGFGSMATVSLRGANSNQTAVFLDGVPLTDPNFGLVDLSNLPADIFDRVEIYRGYIPARFGVSAIGGILNLRTGKPREQSRQLGIVSLGSFERGDDQPSDLDIYRINVADERKIGPVNMLVYYSRWDSRNDYPFYDDNATPFNKSDDVGAVRTNAQVVSDDLLAKVAAPIGRGNATLLVEYFNKKSGVPGIASLPSHNVTYGLQRVFSYGRYETGKLFDDLLDAEITASYRHQREHYRDKLGEVGTGTQNDRLTLSSLNSSVETTLNLAQLWQKWTLRLEGSSENLLQENLMNGGGADLKQRRQRFGLAAEDIIDPLDGRLVLAFSLRAQQIESRFTGETLFTGKSIAPDEKTRSRSENPSVGCLAVVYSGLVVKGSWGRYSREPGFYELFGDRGGVIGNSELKPERGVKWDAGFSVRAQEINPAWPRLDFDVAYFDMDIKDLIIFVQNSQRTSRPDNVSAAHITGFEAMATFSLPDLLLLTTNFTRLWTKTKSAIVYWNNKRIPHRAFNEFDSRAEISFPYSKLFGSLHYQDGKYIDNYNQVRLPPRRIYGVGASAYLFGDTLAVTAEIQNLMHRRYEDAHGFPLPGRTYLATMKLSL